MSLHDSQKQNAPNSQMKFFAIVVGIFAVIGFGFLAVSFIFTDDIKEDKIKVSTLILADNTWSVVQGNVHEKNAKQLRQFTKLLYLKIIDPKLTDDDLVHLKSLPLKALDVSGTSISDRGLNTIGEIKTLEGLLIGDNKRITDAGMITLKQLPKLRVLSVKNTSVTDVGVGTMINFPELGGLDISGLHNVTQNSLRSLSSLPGLTSLQIGKTGIKPDDFEILQKYKGLKGLSVRQMGLTDADLGKLSQIDSIVFLDISSNKKITLAGIEKINPSKYWRLKFENCGLSEKDKHSLEEKILLNIPSPAAIVVDMAVSPKQSDPPGIDRELYSFWYNPTYSTPGTFTVIEPTTPYATPYKSPK